MFGRHPRLPIDLAFGLPADESTQSHSSYVKNLKDRLEESYRVASENASKVARRNKKRFDKRVVASSLEVGDLLPCGFLQDDAPEKPAKPNKPCRPSTRANPGTEKPESMTESSDSESDLMDYYSPVCLPTVESRILSNPGPQNQSSGRVTVEVSPETRISVSIDTEQPTPVKSQENLPDHPDVSSRSLYDDPGKDSQIEDPIEVDVLSDIPVQHQELNGSPIGALSGVNEMNDTLTHEGESNSTSHRDSPVEIGESIEDVRRRPQRHREPPKRLQYPTLGNPLSLVVQSLLQGLSSAFTISLEEFDSLKNTSLEIPSGCPSTVTSQPGRCSGTCISSRRGECNPGKPGY